MTAGINRPGYTPVSVVANAATAPGDARVWQAGTGGMLDSAIVAQASICRIT
jgi:hypothetical protein